MDFHIYHRLLTFNRMTTDTYFDDIEMSDESMEASTYPQINLHHKTLHMGASYLAGFILSIVLTVGMYVVAVGNLLTYRSAVITLLALACIQFVVQSIFFLHLSTKRSSRLRLVMLACTSVVVLILVSGSIWIMFTLNGRMMPSVDQMNQYMNSQQGM
jgi:cytochrome o ubiquinol oxidase operon protein cyoD